MPQKSRKKRVGRERGKILLSSPKSLRPGNTLTGSFLQFKPVDSWQEIVNQILNNYAICGIDSCATSGQIQIANRCTFDAYDPAQLQQTEAADRAKDGRDGRRLTSLTDIRCPLASFGALRPAPRDEIFRVPQRPLVTDE